MRKTVLFILATILISSCAIKRQKEYITVRDTVITPPIVKLDTVTVWNEKLITVYDTTGQMAVTVERIKNNYIRIKAKCQPEKIIVPVTKTVSKTKEIIVQNRFYQVTTMALFIVLIILAFYIYIKKLF